MTRLSKRLLIVAALCLCALTLGARSPDETLWDVYGVPHIFAHDRDAALRQFGCAQIQSHGDRLLRLYGRARGRAAEYWGEASLENDRWVRLNEIPARAQDWAARQTPAFRRSLDAFADGVNTCAARYPDAVSPEVRVVLPVSAVDVLAHAQRVLLFNFVVTPAVLRTLAARPATAASDAVPASPIAASNAWALAPARTANKRALLLANPHLSWSSDEAAFYEAHIVTPDVNVYGATLVGFPVLGIAFNDSLGWTHTVSNLDSADLFQLSTTDGGYLFDGGVRAFEAHSEVIKIKAGPDVFGEVPLNVRRSVHGSVLGDGPAGPVALRVAGLDRHAALEQWWDMAAAKNVREFEAVIARQQIPVFTIVYADRDGHILYCFNGHVPVRASGPYHWEGIVPGQTSATLWTEIRRFPEMPRIVDPPTGWLQSTNDPPWSATWPRVLDPDRFPRDMGPMAVGFRTERSLRLLMAQPRMTLSSLIEAKYSTRMELADHVLDDLLAAAGTSSDAAVRRGVTVLEHWDRGADADSRGAVLFEAFVRLWYAGAKGVPFAKAWSAGSPLDTPSGLANPDQAVAALAQAVGDIEARFGRADVAWGEVYRYQRGAVDLAASGGPGDGLGIFSVVQYTAGSAAQTSKTRAAVFGDSYIAAVEFSTPVQARVLLTYGNASRPGSPHLGDQLSLFAKKQLRTAWRTRAEVLAHLERRDTW
jgi:acyl-homoserine-lactone acylase